MGNPMLSGTPSPSCSTDLSEDENTTLIRYFFKSDFCYDIYKKTFNKRRQAKVCNLHPCNSLK
ncbi:hypothetical protein UY3_16312 [Chelonia mydas]|uniref:Uncharacterized protein n=1 Tax=Chelonia mydas TaxID=8469 RepID=M7AUG2_CHEMY|nr:hypothetical protein UY3_16312 [Chelonia mydas]